MKIERLGQIVRYVGKARAPFVGQIRMMTERSASVQPIAIQPRKGQEDAIVPIGDAVVVPLDDLMPFP